MVTGGAGYIGSVCIEALLEAGHEVLGVDDLSTGNAAAVLNPAELAVIKRADRECWLRLCERFQPDVVMHFAASALIDQSVTNPAPVFQNNVVTTLDLLGAMQAVGVRHFIFSSTAAVYGEPQTIPIREDHPLLPINAYGESKLAIERISAWYRKAYGLRTIAFRYFNASGATARCGELRNEETHAIPILLDTAAGKGPYFSIFGNDYPTADGTCIRDYVHVRDIVDAHIGVLPFMDKLDGEVFNIGSGEGFSVNQLHQEACRITGKDIPVRVAPRRLGDPAVLVADPQKLRKLVGWKPRFSELDQILSSAWEWRLKMAPRA
jgi:UDP-glucose 4-epimerase